jgi:alpha-glucosidase
MVNHHQDIVELAAEYKIMLNIHEGLKDTGLRRTWPNLMTREVARGQEYNAWGDDGGNPLDHVLYVPFTRSLAGPFDYTPGIVNLLFDEYKPDNRVNHTLAKELALYVVIYSPLQMAADLPEHYEERPEPFQFIKDVPADWEDTHVLNAEIGRYITTVRKDRNSDDWYLGSMTDENARTFEIDLTFLDSDTRYVAEIYRDSDDADWESNPYGFVTESKEVTSEDRLMLNLAPGGGQAIRFRAMDK